MSSGLTEKEEVKLAIIATEEISEELVEKMLLDYKLGGSENTFEDDFHELWGALHKHRPELAKKLTAQILASRNRDAK